LCKQKQKDEDVKSEMSIAGNPDKIIGIMKEVEELVSKRYQ